MGNGCGSIDPYPILAPDLPGPLFPRPAWHPAAGSSQWRGASVRQGRHRKGISTDHGPSTTDCGVAKRTTRTPSRGRRTG